MNVAPGQSLPPGTGRLAPEIPPGPDAGADSWSRSRWLMLIALIFIAHVALLYAFGERRPVVPQTAVTAPVLHLAGGSDEQLALNDPTLFALPHRRDYASVLRRQKPILVQPPLLWIATNGWLQLSGNAPGMAFDEFMQTNQLAGLELQLRPPLKLSTPDLPIEPVLPQTSTLRREGGLASRPPLNSLTLTNWPYPDVIAPSIVQVVVDAAGNVLSAVLLPPDDPLEGARRYDNADQYALALTRTIRFEPALHLTTGRLIFNWHTVPVTNPNEPGN